MNIFTAILVQPLYNILVGLYNLIPNLGIDIIIVTIGIRLLLYPLSAKALHSQRSLQSLQPEMARLREKHKGDPQGLNQATMELYKEKEINPLSSCLPTIVQLPILIALYLVFRDVASGHQTNLLYSFIHNPGHIDPYLLGINLSHPDPTFLLPILAAGLQFYQARMLLPAKIDSGDRSQAMSRQLTYFMPVITFFFATRFLAALPLYWITTTAFSIVQQRRIIHRDIEVVEAAPAVTVRTESLEPGNSAQRPTPKRKKRRKR